MKFGKVARGFVRQNLQRFNATWMAILVASFAGMLSLAGCGGSASKQATPTPTLTPFGGTYTTSQTVTIADTATNAVFYCTTDGSTPTTSSAQCATPTTTVSKSETLSVIAVAPGMSASAAASAAYTINLPAAAMPVISPNGGTSIVAQQVTITDSTSSAIIYYTTDGSDPSSSSTRLQYTSALTIASNVPLAETIKAVAVASNYSDSAVASATFNITPPVATPAIASTTGATNVTYPNSLSVTITDADANAVIYYAIGSAPTTSSAKYTGLIAVAAPETVNAIAVDPASGYAASLTASQAFTVTEATPTFSVTAGKVSYGSQVTLNDADSAATISYTTDGTDPASSPSAKTATPGTTVTVSANETLNARAVNTASSYTQSAEATAAYTIPATPTFSGAVSATYSAGFTGLTVTIAADSGATIYYTTDGSTPSATNGTVYGTGITVAQTETVKAIAIVSGASSAVASQSYAVTEATPVFSQPTGSTIATGSGVTITDADPNATIYYTVTNGTTGTTPTTGSTRYTLGTSLTVSAAETIEAIAIDTNTGANYSVSVAASATYYPPNIEPAPTVNSPSGTSTAYPSTLSATLTDTGSNAAICYTLDGSAPTASGTGGSFACSNGTRYTAAITILDTETLTAIAFDTTGSLAASGSASQPYTIAEATPVISPASGSQLLGKVTIDDADPNAAIYYTTDGSSPSTSSTKYAGAFSYTAGQTLVAAAIDTASGSNYTLSAPTSATTYAAYSGNVISGTVQSGSTPISGATVTLYAAGTSNYGVGETIVDLTAGSSAVVSNTVTTAADGSFALGFTNCPTAPGDQLYLVASGGTFGSNSNGANSFIKLMTALGSCSSLPTASGTIAATATVNEVTTIASAYSLAGFSAIDSNGGIDVGAPTNSGQTSCYDSASSVWAVGNSNCNYPGLANAFKTVNNLVNVTGAAQPYTYLYDGTSGSYSDAPGTARVITPAYSNGTTPALTTSGALNSSGCSTSQSSTSNPCPVVQYMNSSTVPQARINTLANILAACVEDSTTGFTVCKNGSTGLLDLAVTSAGAAPSDTLQAALNLAHNPGAYVTSTTTSNTSTLFDLQPATDTSTPAPAYGSYASSTLLAAAPNDFTLALSFTGAGLGNPSAASGAGFSNLAFALDAYGNIFVSGYQSSVLESTIAVFNNQGVPLTPPTTVNTTTGAYTYGGYVNSSEGFLGESDAMAFDEAGNLWVGGVLDTNIGALALTSSGLGVAYGDTSLVTVAAPYSLAVDTSGNIWIGTSSTYFAEVTATSGASAATLDGKSASLGLGNTFLNVMLDSAGNLWAKTNSNKLYYYSSSFLTATKSSAITAGSILAPVSSTTAGSKGGVFGCNSGSTAYNIFTTSGAGSNPYTPPSGQCAYGALDGGNHFWIWQSKSGSPSYFDVLSLSGSGTSTSFSLLSPSTGYTGTTSADTSLMGQTTRMAVDGSGNIWILNGTAASSTTGNGNALVEFVGAAAPTIQPVSVALQNAAAGTKP